MKTTIHVFASTLTLLSALVFTLRLNVWNAGR